MGTNAGTNAGMDVGTNVMRAVWYESNGPAGEVLVTGEMARPEPREGEVLVRLHASGVNPSDVKARAGARPMAFDRVIPHSDGAGVVEAVGGSKVGGFNGGDFKVGDRVFIRNGQWRRALGSAAAYIALDAGLVHPLPDAVSFEVGASLGIPGMTAAHAVLKDGPVDGASLLVQGGGGTVARLAVQIARASGARVITTSSRADQRRRLIGLGASAALDYRDPELAHQIIAANGGRPIDRVIDAEVGANLDTSLEVLREGGVIAGYGSVKHPNPELPFLKMMFKNITLSSILVYLLEDDDAARYAAILGQMLTAGTVQLSVAAALGLEEAALAHEMVEAGNRDGAVVLTV